MARFTFDTYEKKQAYAERRNRENAEIKTLTEEQHEALAELCRIRHEMHCNQDSIFNSESSEYREFNRNFCEDGTVSQILTDSELPNINLLDISDLPCSDDYYELLDEDERIEWEDRAAQFNNQNNSTMKHTGFSIWVEESGDYNNFHQHLETLNKQIEDYLLTIDKKHGTSYCPTGLTR